VKASANRVPTRNDLPAIVALLERANETPYDIARVAEEKVFGPGVTGDARPVVYEEDGAIRGVAITCGEHLRLIAVDPEYRRRGIGSQLLGGRIAFAEPGNYFTPGVIESDAVTRAFLARHGFVEDRWTFNLETTELPASTPSGVQRVDAASRDRVLAFVESHFGVAWRFECEKAGDRLFFIESNGGLAGFAAHDANNRGLGCFGPTGVVKSMRGRGFGSALVRAALADLRALGFTRVVIPWTDAIRFYEAVCGARVKAKFWIPRREKMRGQ
jgi:GNAT superfamily N-acetyltransferase